MIKTIFLSAAIALIAGTASATTIRECNETNATFADKRACAGNPGTSSMSASAARSLLGNKSSISTPSAEPTPDDHGPGKGKGKGRH